MKKHFTLLMLGAVLCTSTLFSSVVVAQSPTVQPSAPQAVKVASVGIEDAKIVSQEGNVITLSFTFVNEELAQAGVRYGVTLISEKDKKQTVMDDFVYEESLTLAENSSTPKEITYIAPAQLTGTYDIYINSKNNNGFPFAAAKVGSVELVATTKGVTIDTQTCYTRLPQDSESVRRPILLAPTLGPDTVLTLVCTVTNTSDTLVTVIPTFETRYLGGYGTTISHEGGDTTPIVFTANEKKTISVTLPKVSKPRTYIIAMTLTGAGSESNTVTAQYYIPGTIATIVNANLTKDYYVKGDSAEAVILRATDAEIIANVSIRNENGRSCAETVTQTIPPTNEPVVRMNLPIIRDCYGPQLSVVLTDKDGAVLDTQEYEFATTSVPKPTMPWQTAALIVGGIIILGAGALYIRHRMHTNEDNTITN